MTFADSSDVPTDIRSALRANCADCFALCCTAFGFQRSADFPIDKPAGTPCSNLTDDFSCSIHDSLRPRGFRGCTVFDCFGAGQYVSQTLFGGTSWKERPETSADMFGTFAVVRQLHEMLWYLVEALELTTMSDLAEPVSQLRDDILRTLDGDASLILASDVEGLRAEVRRTLIEVSEEAMRLSLPTGASCVRRRTWSVATCDQFVCAVPISAVPTSSRRIFAAPTWRASTCSVRICVTRGSREQTRRVRCFSHNYRSMRLRETAQPCCHLRSGSRDTGSARR